MHISGVPEFSVPGVVSVRLNPGKAETIGNVVLKRFSKCTKEEKVSHPEIPDFFSKLMKIQEDSGLFFVHGLKRRSLIVLRGLELHGATIRLKLRPAEASRVQSCTQYFQHVRVADDSMLRVCLANKLVRDEKMVYVSYELRGHDFVFFFVQPF